MPKRKSSKDNTTVSSGVKKSKSDHAGSSKSIDNSSKNTCATSGGDDVGGGYQTLAQIISVGEKTPITFLQPSLLQKFEKPLALENTNHHGHSSSKKVPLADTRQQLAKSRKDRIRILASSSSSSSSGFSKKERISPESVSALADLWREYCKDYFSNYKRPNENSSKGSFTSSLGLLEKVVKMDLHGAPLKGTV